MTKSKKKEEIVDATQFVGQPVLDGYIGQLDTSSTTSIPVLIFNKGIMIAKTNDWIISYPDGKTEVIANDMFVKLFDVIK